LDHMPEFHHTWNGTIMWVEDIQGEVEFNARMHRNPFSDQEHDEVDFSYTSQVVTEIGAKFGRFQDLDCRSLKLALLSMETNDDGRVLLSDFHQSTVNGGVHFTESAEHLRSQGILDESMPQLPRVVIANYVNGRANCFDASHMYKICCIDECDSLMVQLEHKLGASSGSPQSIAEFVAITSSDTIDAPRNLSGILLDRLSDIAAYHGGIVPLHGRLFAQWMHHAYPRECQYPQAGISTTYAEQSFDEDMPHASQEELESHNVSSETFSNGTNASVELPWSDEEELVLLYEPATTHTPTIFRGLAMLAIVVSVYFAFQRKSKTAPSCLLMYNCRSNPSNNMAHFV